jgi:hypothetical protein
LYNKKILNVFDFPYTCALTQLGAGLLYIVPKYLFFSKLREFIFFIFGSGITVHLPSVPLLL